MFFFGFCYPGFGYQSELELRVAEAARRQYNKLKMQTKAEIRQTIDQLLVGEFIVRVLLKCALNMTECNFYSYKNMFYMHHRKTASVGR